MKSQRYSYCFLRYHHDPLSGEFANVGLVLWAPESSFLGFRGVGRYSRLNKFFSGFNSADYRSHMNRISTKFAKLSLRLAEEQSHFLPLEKRPRLADEIAIEVIPHDSSSLRWGPSMGGLIQNPEVELEHLYQRHILRHYKESISARRNDEAVFKDVYQKAFTKNAVAAVIQEHHIKSELAAHTFPQAWKNGTWNVYETLSFDYVKAEQIRDKGHKWGSKTNYLREAEDVKITYLLGAPEGQNKQAYETAKKLLLRAKASIIEENEAKDFARDLQSRIVTLPPHA